MTTFAPVIAAPDRSVPRAVTLWLALCAAMVFAMAVIGAITRLTESGLSMVEWRPLIGMVPPLSTAAWQRVFDLYRETPQYRFVNLGMTLAEFQSIFWWEWFHRLWGQVIGFVVLLPLIRFSIGGAIPWPLGRRLIALFALGGLQGGIGWFMVASGLVDRPAVSHYRLALHLVMATLIYGGLLWCALDRFPPCPDRTARRLRRHTLIALILAATTLVWGAFVAGLRAGSFYNTFPLMNGDWLPPEAFSLTPGWINWFENVAAVQFAHRGLALSTAITVLTLAWRSQRHRAALGPLPWLVAAVVLVQVGLGVTTLLTHVAIIPAALHQAGALTLISVLIALRHRLREGA
ncbi:MAG: COX15/CtaA family protein [Azospirillaceae bacterium]|nr:COX15/CtaA family protein [Azospirillaceae bacterium]